MSAAIKPFSDEFEEYGRDGTSTRVSSETKSCRTEQRRPVSETLSVLPVWMNSHSFFNVLKGDSGIIGTTKKNLDFTGVSLA